MLILAAPPVAHDLQMILWIGLVAAMLLCCGCGFVAGLQLAPWFQSRAMKRAAAHLQEMYRVALEQLTVAQACCEQLAQFREPKLAATQLEQLKRSRGRLIDSLNDVVRFQTPPSAPVEEATKSAPAAFEVTWPKSPLDSQTGLPDKAAFDTAMKLLIAANQTSQATSGLLMVRMDKSQQLSGRFGAEGLVKLQSRLASLLIRSVRDADCVCRVGADLFGILLPQIDEETGRKIAEKVRETVRQHHFRVEDSGPEVLVTASFGFVLFGSADQAALVIDRATTAVLKSQSFGRNQLHVHSAELAGLCRV